MIVKKEGRVQVTILIIQLRQYKIINRKAIKQAVVRKFKKLTVKIN